MAVAYSIGNCSGIKVLAATRGRKSSIYLTTYPRPSSLFLTAPRPSSPHRYLPIDRIPAEAQALTDSKVPWVTIGVVADKGFKGLSKTSANGGKYMIWNLTDLKGTSVSAFLFREAHTKHWQMSEGSVVLLFNAEVLPAKEDGRFALSISHAGKLAKLGTSAHFGHCKANRKDGNPCTR